MGNETLALTDPDDAGALAPALTPARWTLEDLYRDQYGPMVRLAHLITGSNEVAEDVVQEAFVRIYRNFDRADKPVAYLRTVVVNRCRTWQRRRMLERLHATPAAPASGPGTAAAVAAAAAPVEVDETLAALDRLAPRRRAALVLRFYADLSEADIASALGCRPGTVKSLISRGLAELKETIAR